jgi:hypothetical protein
MQKSIHRVATRSIGLSIVVIGLLQTSCTRPAPPPQDYSVGVVDSVMFDEKTLTLHHLRLFSDGFLMSKNLPSEDELKGRVLFQIEGLKRATEVSVKLGAGLQLAGAPHDSATAKAGRERYVTLSADEYTLTQYSPQGEATDIPTLDIELIILD